MQLEVFRGSELHRVLQKVRAALGEDAMIVRTRVIKRAEGNVTEILAAKAEWVRELQRLLDDGHGAVEANRSRLGPRVIALVGPAGAGKTTSAVKMALHPRALGSRSVGILTLDTYRVGALEQIQTYAEIADLPLEVAYNPVDAHGALQRMRDRDVVIVDCPGRGFGGGAAEWVKILSAIDPDETHLVVPAAWRQDVARELRDALDDVVATHALFTKLDEPGANAGLVELVEALDLPVRWVADSPEIPGGLGPASERILAALHVPAEGASPRRRVG